MTNRKKGLTKTETVTLGIIREAALAGLPCPTNKEIAKVPGGASRSHISFFLKRMGERGIVKVTSGNGERCVEILNEGISTTPLREQAPVGILRTLREAALAGDMCPTNLALAHALGLKSSGRISIHINKMVKDGILAVEHKHGKRKATIVGEDIATADIVASVYKPRPRPKRNLPDINKLWAAGEHEGITDMMELTDKTCRYPLNDDTKAPVACGEPTQHGSPYCPSHHAYCYEERRRRRVVAPEYLARRAAA